MFDEVLDNFRVDRLQTVVEDVGFKTLEKSSVRDAVRPEPLVYAVEKKFYYSFDTNYKFLYKFLIVV